LKCFCDPAHQLFFPVELRRRPGALRKESTPRPPTRSSRGNWYPAYLALAPAVALLACFVRVGRNPAFLSVDQTSISWISA
jgi:hypothetical protein